MGNISPCGMEFAFHWQTSCQSPRKKKMRFLQKKAKKSKNKAKVMVGSVDNSNIGNEHKEIRNEF